MTRAKNAPWILALSALVVVAAGCVQVTHVEPFEAEVITQSELEATSLFGADSRFEPRRLHLSADQKLEFAKLTGDVAPEEVFFYHTTVRQVFADGGQSGRIGEIYIERGMADTGRFSYLIFVSHGTVSKITLRKPGSIDKWEHLAEMLKALEGTTLETIELKKDSQLKKDVRRALALHAILAPAPFFPSSPIKPV